MRDTAGRRDNVKTIVEINVGHHAIHTHHLEVVVRSHAVVRKFVLGGPLRPCQESVLAPRVLVGLEGGSMQTAVASFRTVAIDPSRHGTHYPREHLAKHGLRKSRKTGKSNVPVLIERERERATACMRLENIVQYLKTLVSYVRAPPPTSSAPSRDAGVASAPVKAISSGLMPTPCKSLKSRGMCRNGGLFRGFPCIKVTRDPQKRARKHER